MGEIKSVKVDNWGVFFLQKLQNFFNKTDYCDLTLQFNDNSQLKVHRLVLSACTDYFNILEIQSDVVDNTLLMPRGFQADVVVPIVNFMYTGTLEFEYRMYDRLFRTAREMNMTVLVKLLEAHRKTTPKAAPPPIQSNPVLLNKSAGNIRATNVRAAHSAQIPIERTYSSSSKPPPARNIKHTPATSTNTGRQTNITQYVYPASSLPETIELVSKYRPEHSKKSGPSRFDPTEEETLPESIETFNTLSYESTPLMKAEEKDEDDEDEYGDGGHSSSSSTFEQLRKGYTNTSKRSATKSSIALPPAKKLNLQDVKEYTEAARLRKQLEVDDNDDDPNYIYDDDTHFNDDDDEDNPQIVQNVKTIRKNPVIKSEKNEDDGNQKKANEGESVHHAKIISEVLKKYPHLVKNNKNIKLKIMQKNTSPSQTKATFIEHQIKTEKTVTSPSFKSQVKIEKVDPDYQSQIVNPPIKTITTAHPKKIDSKTMHALIAKGAENMTGPWLCLKCGVGGRPISIPSYKSFRRHLVTVHKQKIDPLICEHCGWKVNKKDELVDHYLNAHNIRIKIELVNKPTAIPSTSSAIQSSGPFRSLSSLKQAKIVDNSKRNVQHCIYCNKVFSKEMLLYSHMKTFHKQKAREDGVIDFSDEEQDFDEHDKYIPNDPSGGGGSSQEKVKIISSITIPPPKSGMPFVLDSNTLSQIKSNVVSQQSIVNLEPSSEAEALSNVASGIATSLGLVDESHFTHDAILGSQYADDVSATVAHSDSYIHKKDETNNVLTKLVTPDGRELTQFQKDEIMSQLQRQSDLTDEVVMVLDQDSFEGGEIINTDDPNIVVVYSQQTENNNSKTIEWNQIEKNNQPSTSNQESLNQPSTDGQNNNETTKEESANILATICERKSPDSEADEKSIEKSSEKLSQDEDKLKLISALEGDWTDDEDDETIKERKLTKGNVPIVGESLELLQKTINEENDAKKSSSPVSTTENKETNPEVVFDIVTESAATLNKSNETLDQSDNSLTKTTEENIHKGDLSNILSEEWSSASFDEGKPLNESSEIVNEGEYSDDKIKPEEYDIETKLKSNLIENTERKQKNSELKTLINDWEDEDTDL